MAPNKQAVIQQKIDSIKGLVERQYEIDGEPGMMYDYPRCIDPINDIWEMAFVIHLNDTLYSTLKSSWSSNNSMLNFSTTYRSFEFNNCLVPIVLTRINKNEELTFASLLRLELFKEKKHPMENVNLLKILNEQQKLYIDLVASGKKLPGVYLTNQMKGYLSADVAKLDRVKFDRKTDSNYSITRTNLVFQIQLETHDIRGHIGQKLWNKVVGS
jgi:hypothetical protein